MSPAHPLVSRPVPAPAGSRPLIPAPRRHRRLRANLLQALGVVIGLVLGLVVARFSFGPTVNSSVVTQLLIGIAAGGVPFIALVYALLFFVVEFSWTSLTPRLNLFRDDPVVWRSFAFFLGLVVWAGAAALGCSSHQLVGASVPVAALVGVVAALVIFRNLVRAAFDSIQLAPTLRDICRHGRAVIEAMYPEAYGGEEEPTPPLPPVTAELRWPRPGGVLRQIEYPTLIRAASAARGVVELTVTPGDVLREGGVFARVHGGHEGVDGVAVAASFEVGLERTFDQDPRFAFRLLSDIALRALSPAINDPATAVQAVDAIDVLLSTLSARRLDIGQVVSPEGSPAAVIPFPTWDDYVECAVADTARAAHDFVIVEHRLARLLDELATAVHPSRLPAIDRWRGRPDEGDGAGSQGLRARAGALPGSPSLPAVPRTGRPRAG